MSTGCCNFNKFYESSIGSKGLISDFTSVISPKGDFSKITGLNVILRSWNMILSTPKRSVDHDPEFGSELYKYIFEPADDKTSEKIVNEVRTVLAKYDDRARVADIEVVFFNDKKGFSLNIYVDYDNETSSFPFVLDESQYFNYFNN
jgi:phage baseplate assembly protein W